MALKRRRPELTDTLLNLPEALFKQATTSRTASGLTSTTYASTSARAQSSSGTSRRPTSRTLSATTSSQHDETVARPKPKSKPRTQPDGSALPVHLQPRTLKVTQRTLDSYHKHIREFETWARERGHRVNANSLDRLVVRYMTELALEDMVQPSVGAYLVFGLQLLRCTKPRVEFLPLAKEALAGWRKLVPGGMRLPVPEEFIFDYAHLALDDGLLDIAFGMILQYDTYLRPSECLALTHAHLGFPAGGRYNKWSIVIAPFQLGSATKTGKFDDSVLVADKSDAAGLQRQWSSMYASTRTNFFLGSPWPSTRAGSGKPGSSCGTSPSA